MHSQGQAWGLQLPIFEILLFEAARSTEKYKHFDNFLHKFRGLEQLQLLMLKE